MSVVWAMSFARWRCTECRQVVDWEDAFYDLDDGRLVGVRHLECVDG